MRILQLCKKFPYPAKDGESLAILNLSKSLAEQGAEIHMLAMNTLRHQVKVDPSASALQHYQSICTVEVDNRLKPTDAFFNLFSTDSYHISRFVSPVFESKLKELLSEYNFDIIQLETLYLAPYIECIKTNSHAKISMRAHNIEFEIWQRITRNTSNPLKKAYLSHLTKKLERYEKSQFNKYDILLPISGRDKVRYKALGFKGKDEVVPIGVDSGEYIFDQDSVEDFNRISFIGSLDWAPNIEGIEWFLKNIWPVLSKEFPKLELFVAGRNMPKWLKESNYKGINIIGEVEDAKKFILSCPIMIVPLLSGSGMRVKILEGMALGRVVVTTSIGLEGIDARHQHEVWIANKKEEFLEAFRQSRTELENIGKNARTFIEVHFDRNNIGKKVLEKYQELI
ncbi:MAG: glycosyltransferase family 4 protein [Bacteroidota bacterium]